MIDYPIEIDKWRSYFEAGARPSSDEGLAMLDEIDRLRAFAESFGRCNCAPGQCLTKSDFQCAARYALDGIDNEQLTEGSK